MKSRRRKSRRYTGKKKNDRNRSVIMILLILAFVALVVFLTIRLGLHLREKAMFSEEHRDGIPDVTDTAQNYEFTGDYSQNVSVKLNGKYVSLKDNDRKYEEDVALISEGDFVSLVFRDSSGELTFSSQSAQNLGRQDEDNGLLTAEEIITPLKDKGCTVCAVFCHSAYDAENTAESDAVRAFESAIIAEICASGADEVMLCGLPSLTAEEIDRTSEYAEILSSKYAGKTKIGLLIPYASFSEGDGNSLCRTLAPVFDFLAVDYTDAPAEEDTADEISARAGAMQLFFSRYGIRAVLDAEKENGESESKVLSDAAIYQVLRIAADEVSRED